MIRAKMKMTKWKTATVTAKTLQSAWTGMAPLEGLTLQSLVPKFPPKKVTLSHHTQSKIGCGVKNENQTRLHLIKMKIF